MVRDSWPSYRSAHLPDSRQAGARVLEILLRYMNIDSPMRSQCLLAQGLVGVVGDARTPHQMKDICSAVISTRPLPTRRCGRSARLGDARYYNLFRQLRVD